MLLYGHAQFMVVCMFWYEASGERRADRLADEDHLSLENRHSEEWFWNRRRGKKSDDSSGEPLIPSTTTTKPPKCDLDAKEWKTYGDAVVIDEVEPVFWDTCKKVDGKCPETCLPLSKALNLTWMQRLQSWKFGCKKECRYTDEYMLEDARHKSFFATTLAVLDRKVDVFHAKCRRIWSWFSPRCGARQRRIGSMLGFVLKATAKASQAAGESGVPDCQERMSPSMGAALSEIVGKLLDQLQEDGKDMEEGEELSKTVERVKIIASRLKDPEFCQKSADIAEKMRDPNVVEMMKRKLQEASGEELDVDDVEEELAERGTGGAIQEQLTRDARRLDALVVGVQTRAAGSSLLQAHAEGEANSSVAMSLAELFAVQDSTHMVGVLHNRQSGNMTAASLQDLGGIVWFVKGLWYSLVALLYHGIIGTVYGTFTTVMCLISLGEYTNDEKSRSGDSYDSWEPERKSEGITSLHGKWKLTWLVTCPVACMSWGWGINPYHMDDSFWVDTWSHDSLMQQDSKAARLARNEDS